MAGAGELTPAERRGKQIYEQGTSASGKPLRARIQPSGEAVPAGILPCAGCHGADGRGKPEGGVTPSNIRWDALTKPYKVLESGSRQRPPYDERLFRRAVAMGFDPAGNTLDTAMPRFEMSLADAADLTAYIRRLGDLADPGVSDTAIRIGAVLPPADQAVWSRFADRVNSGGGIYGRRIEPVFFDRPEDAAAHADEIFLLAIAGSPPDGAAFPSVVVEEEFPRPNTGTAFYLDSGAAGEAAALCARFTADAVRRARKAVVVADDSVVSQTLAGLVRRAIAAAGLPEPWKVPPERAGEIGPAEVGAVFWLSRAKIPAAPAFESAVELMVPGALASAALPDPIAHPGIRAIVATSSLRGLQPAAGSRTAVAAVVIAEALQRAGRELTRTGFILGLESLRNFETGLLAPIGYSANHRDGVETQPLFVARAVAGKWELIPVPAR
jgi:hypothetical protein